MGIEQASGELITGISVSDYFRSSVDLALNHQQVDAADETIFYVVNLLSYYSSGDPSFTRSQSGIFTQPLAVMYMRAVDAESVKEQQASLRRLGDVALMMSSLRNGNVERPEAGIDYYVAMGSAAYAFLSELSSGAAHERLYGIVFGELSAKFRTFVDVIAEVIENAHATTQTDLLRLYDIWARTGSNAAAARLRQLGIEPCAASISKWQN